MSSVSFFTPITYGPFAVTKTHSLIEAVDDYFFLGGKKAQVIPIYLRGNHYFDKGQRIDVIVAPPEQKSIPVAYVKTELPFFKTLLKVISYVTIIIPLIALAAKAILRSTHSYHQLAPTSCYIGDRDPKQLDRPIRPDLVDLSIHPMNIAAGKSNEKKEYHYDEDGNKFRWLNDEGKRYTLDTEEIKALKLRSAMEPISSDIRVSYTTLCYSDLEVYKTNEFNCVYTQDHTGNFHYHVQKSHLVKRSIISLYTPENGLHSLGEQFPNALWELGDGSRYFHTADPLPGFECGVLMRY